MIYNESDGFSTISHLFECEHDALDGLGTRHEQLLRSDVVLCSARDDIRRDDSRQLRFLVKEDGNRDDAETSEGPDVLHEEALHHGVENGGGEDMVHVFHKVEVAEGMRGGENGVSPALENLLLNLVSTVEGDLLRVGDETAVDETEVALQLCLLGHQPSKVGLNPLQHLGRQVDHSHS